MVREETDDDVMVYSVHQFTLPVLDSLQLATQLFRQFVLVLASCKVHGAGRRPDSRSGQQEQEAGIRGSAGDTSSWRPLVSTCKDREAQAPGPPPLASGPASTSRPSASLST